MLYDIGGNNLHLDVRMNKHGQPLFYLSRIKDNFWQGNPFIIEDLYVSPGYDFYDDQFVRLFYMGHEIYYMRLSLFRTGVVRSFFKSNETNDEEVDSILSDVGKNIFSTAWHEHQRPACLTANNFGLNNLKQAVEVLYLILSSELCELRSKINDDTKNFFNSVYVQPAINGLLYKIERMEGDDFHIICDRASRQYKILTKEFNRFMSTEIKSGHLYNGMPLYKIILANFFRLNLIADHLNKRTEIRKAADKLESVAREIICQIVN